MFKLQMSKGKHIKSDSLTYRSHLNLEFHEVCTQRSPSCGPSANVFYSILPFAWMLMETQEGLIFHTAERPLERSLQTSTQL